MMAFIVLKKNGGNYMISEPSMQRLYRRNILKLNLIRFLFWMHFFAAVLVPFYTGWGKISLFQVFLLNAWFMLWNFLLEVPTGTVADYLGRKTSLALGSLAAMGAALVYVSAPRFWVFLLAEIVFAAAYTLHSGADEALAYDSLVETGEERRSKSVLARMESFKLAGILAGTVTGGFMAARWGLTAPMTAQVVPACLAAFIALTLKEPVARVAEGDRPSYLKILVEGGRFFLGHRVVLLLTVEMAVTNALAFTIIWLYQPLLGRSGMPLKYFGIVHAACALAQILLLSRVERIEPLAGSKRRFLLFMAVAAGACFVLLGVVQNLPAVVAAVVIAFTAGLPRVPLFSSYLNKYIPSPQRATVLSFVSMSRTLAIVIVNPLAGLLADWSLSGTMIVLGVLLIVLSALSRIEEGHLVD